MEKAQYSKLFESIPEADIYISMGCNVVCPYVAGKKNVNWGLEDPTGMDDEAFLKVIRQIEKNVIELRKSMLSKKYAKVDKGICAACGACTKECPKSAISIWKGCYAAVDELVCIGCGKCAKICPAGCILTVDREVAES